MTTYTVDNEVLAAQRRSRTEPRTEAELAGSGTSGRVRSRADRTRSPYWILVEEEPPLTVFTLQARNGAPVLPVFSSYEEAACFAAEAPMATRTLGIRESGGGELVSLLSAPLSGVRHVALDPPGIYLPEALELVCVGRRIFLDRLLGRGRSWMRGSGDRASDPYPPALAGVLG